MQVLVRPPQQVVVLDGLVDDVAELLLVGGEELVEGVKAEASAGSPVCGPICSPDERV
jgi:hypothetical protein